MLTSLPAPMFGLTQIDKAFTMLSRKLIGWGQEFIVMLPNLLIAALVLVATLYAARLVKRGVTTVFPRISHSAALRDLVATLSYVVVLLIGLFFVLEVLNLQKTVTSLLAGVGIIGLALGFAFQDIAANFISGIILVLQRPFTVGDVIKTNDYTGLVERVSLRTTDLRQATGELVRVPNRKVFENALINFTINSFRRVDVECGVTYDADLDQVRSVALAAIREVPNLAPERQPDVMFTEFGESAIAFQVRFWVPFERQLDYVSAKSEAIVRIKRAFDAAGIVIPFPIRTLDVPETVLRRLAPPPADPPETPKA
ncbi:mechanosensitive ion channel family protein [Hymenobacter sp. APR13]|uniref:mechanosensitive ion channel family protein n=1 Tax=Hymenobacter sp. APR13 TaxID=1356852 RepID=UPI001E541B4E|nr:mechanosensitive ion channel family protein [Hymenobacter sp. APR13]